MNDVPPPAITVTAETYIHAESDRSFANTLKLTGGVNNLYHFRKPTPLDGQTVVRMNRDTLYSPAVIDTSKGATITLPQPDAGRYMSVLVIDNDHYAPAVFYEPGTHQLPATTKYVMAVVRTQLLKPLDPADLAKANALQDQIVVKSNSADPFPPLKWDIESLFTLTRQYELGSKKFPSWAGMMGPRGTVDEANRHFAAAAAWGLFPEKDATYLNYSGGQDAAQCYAATYHVPENSAFWSITVYGADGYMKSDNAILNKANVALNPDGTFTAVFGPKDACGDRPNRIDTSEGWNFLMRVYKPRASVLDGSYKLPDPVPLKR